jgi:hypothetical protein
LTHYPDGCLNEAKRLQNRGFADRIRANDHICTRCEIELDIFKSPKITVRIPMKVVSDSDLIPVTCSEVKAVVFGAKRRWRSYGA